MPDRLQFRDGFLMLFIPPMELIWFMKKFHIVTPIDPDRSDLKGRNDILKKWEETIRSEAPYAYKDIHQVVKVHEEHGMAGLVARMEPVFTVKA
mgnify:CR=1 FL=1